MNTTIRHNAAMEVVINFSSVCLVCLQLNEGNEMRSVFEPDEQTPPITIAEKIANCSELRPQNKNSKLPDKICARCLSDLTAAWRFLRNCETAQSVFQTIQQEEEEAEEMTTLELEQQKIILPSGLKIKRIRPETKTYLLPVQLDDEEIEEEVAHGYVEVLSESGVIGKDINEVPAVEVEELATVAVHEIDEEDKMDFEEYYEEELLDEETKEELDAMSAVKLEEQQQTEESADEDSTRAVEDEWTVEMTMQRVKEEVCHEKEPTPKAPTIESVVHKRRGRPRKATTTAAGASSQHPQIKSEIKSEKENLIDSEQILPDDVSSSPAKEQHNKNTSKSSSPQSPSTKPIPSPQKSPLPTRKRSVVSSEAPRQRKSSSADSRPPKICEICGNSYRYQHALNAHMRRHTNTRPFNCEFCDRAFVSNVELRRHMRVHTGHKPYGCAYCERHFSDFGSRIKHERTHTGERPYKCHTCNKSFAYAHVLSVHMLTHTGEKRFNCTRCGKGFTKKILPADAYGAA